MVLLNILLKVLIMLVFFGFIVLLGLALFGAGLSKMLPRTSRKKDLDVPLDYRHNGHNVTDHQEVYTTLGRTDRITFHREGDAYKQDEHKHF